MRDLLCQEVFEVGPAAIPGERTISGTMRQTFPGPGCAVGGTHTQASALVRLPL